MRIAVLIGVADYNTLSTLSGCLKDVEAVKKLLEASKEFDDIVYYSGKVESNILKEKLSSFFDKYKSKEISELFFYFTGHGDYHGDDFYYLLSDYNERNRRQTSLQNSEIDTLIKSIAPTIVTKIIDACHSGVPYVKNDSTNIKKHYEETKNTFNKCYFLHSSMTNQYSFQDDELSHFTKSILKSIKKSNKQEIRYKDIIDYVSDEFEQNSEQTPFFVNQANFTEVFIQNNTEIKDVLSVFIQNHDEHTETKQSTTNKTLLDKIKEDAKNCSSEKEVNELLISLKNFITSKNIGEQIYQLFDIELKFETELLNFPRKKDIGKWLSDNKHSFFAIPTYKTEEYNETSYDMLSPLRSQVNTKYKDVLDGFNLTITPPYKSIFINFNPKYPNISNYVILITFLISKREIKFFYALTEYTEIDWKNKKMVYNFNFNIQDFSLKDEDSIKAFLNKICDDVSSNILDFLNKKHNMI